MSGSATAAKLRQRAALLADVESLGSRKMWQNKSQLEEFIEWYLPPVLILLILSIPFVAFGIGVACDIYSNNSRESVRQGSAATPAVVECDCYKRGFSDGQAAGFGMAVGT